MANGIAEAFISFGMETRVGTSENAGDFLGKQITTLRAEVADLEHAAQKYGESKEIIPTSGQSNTALSALEDFQRAFTAAQAERAEKEAAFTALRAAPDTAVPQVQSSPLIQELTTQVASLEREQAELARKFKPGWPALAGVSTKLEQARDRLRTQIVGIASGARQETETAFRQAVERERNLAVLLTQQKQAVLKLSTDSIEYTNLRSEITKKRETLDQLLKRQSEISLSSHMRDARQSSTRVIDVAQIPRTVYRPNGKMNMFLGLLAGLGLGVVLAFGIEFLDNTVKSPEELAAHTGYATIGVIPEHRPAGPRALRKDSGQAATDPSMAFGIHLDPHSQISEAYKDLRTATMLASPDQPPRTIMVTSCLPQEGKSQTSLNLAIALAQTGKRVLLVDSDLRRPRLHKALGLDNDRGLSTFLSGNAPVEQLIQSTLIPHLHALTSGPIPPNPSELLASRAFLTLAQAFAEAGSFDHLIFDSPPLLSVADSVVIANVVDGSILVVYCGKTPREALARGAGKLRQGGAKVLGAVLNGVPGGDHSLYYYRYQGSEEKEAGPSRRAGSSA